MFVGTVGLFFLSGSSTNLAAAYGIAVSRLMIITTLLMYRVTRHRFGERAAGGHGRGVFPVHRPRVFLANAFKDPHGGWFPLLLGAAIFTVMSTWARGRAIVAEHLRVPVSSAAPICQRCHQRWNAGPQVAPVFLSQQPDITRRPYYRMSGMDIARVRVLLTVRTEHVPFVPAGAPLEITPIQEQLFQVVARCGFMETPDIPRVPRSLPAWPCAAGTRHTFFPQPDYVLATSRAWRSGGKNCLWCCRAIPSAPVRISIYRPNRWLKLGWCSRFDRTMNGKFRPLAVRLKRIAVSL